ncbi:MAG: hypothetical protein Fur0023_07840 [Bacteroidia bacterium]
MEDNNKEYRSILENVSLLGFNTYINMPAEADIALSPEKNKLKKALKKRNVIEMRESVRAVYSMPRYTFDISNIIMIANHFLQFCNVLLVLP